MLIAGILVPSMLALSEGNDWGWVSAATLGCFAISVVAAVAVRRRREAGRGAARRPRLLRNAQLVGATVAILIVAGAINALMYVLSLYFQNPAAFGMSALEAGLATLPAAAAMILVTPADHAAGGQVRPGAVVGDRLPARRRRLRARWRSCRRAGPTRAFVGPLVVLSIGLAFANGPASSASTSAVSADEVGAASGISNMARYVGARSPSPPPRWSTTRSPTTTRAGESASDALAAGLGAPH